MTKYNKSKIFKDAWESWRLAKKRNIKKTWSECLKFAWDWAKAIVEAEVIRAERAKKRYTQIDVVDWFAAKKYTEKFHSRLYQTRLTAIIQETEKAVYGLLACDVCGCVASWIPKSCLISSETDRDDHETVKCNTLKEAFEIYNDRMSFFR